MKASAPIGSRVQPCSLAGRIEPYVKLVPPDASWSRSIALCSHATNRRSRTSGGKVVRLYVKQHVSHSVCEWCVTADRKTSVGAVGIATERHGLPLYTASLIAITAIGSGGIQNRTRCDRRLWSSGGPEERAFESVLHRDAKCPGLPNRMAPFPTRENFGMVGWRDRCRRAQFLQLTASLTRGRHQKECNGTWSR